MAEAKTYSIIKPLTYKIISEYFHSENTDFIIRCHRKNIESNSYLHLTVNSTAILESKNIFLSAGGLGSCVYAVPIFSDGRIHNLGAYIKDIELPAASSREQQVKGFVIKVDYETNVGIVDYLSFGRQYITTYEESNDIRKRIKHNELVNKSEIELLLAKKLLSLLSGDYGTQSLKEINKVINKSNILNVLLFEVMNEYFTVICRASETTDEMYSDGMKNLVYELCPDMRSKFSLSRFKPNLISIVNYLNQNVSRFSTDDFLSYVNTRMIEFINKYIIEDNRNLMGQVLFRCFDSRIDFEKKLSDEILANARKNNISVVSYFLPKGEVGVLPSIGTKIFSASIVDNHCSNLKTTSVTLSDKLIPHKYSILRKPYD